MTCAFAFDGPKPHTCFRGNLGGNSNRRAFFATVGPERQKFYALRIVEHSKIQKMPDARNVNSSHIWQVYVGRATRGQA
jgi:hypothetical protein